jgi:putative glycosyltransferase (TIGR04372 family)
MMITQITKRAYWQLQLARWRKYGSIWLIGRCSFKMVGLWLQPLALIAHLLGFRKVNVAERHIGHLVSEPDCLLKLVQLNRLPKKYYFICVSIKNVANPCLLEYWRNHILVITSPFLNYLLSAASTYGFLGLDVTDFVATETTAAQYYGVNSLWKRSPLLLLSDSHRCLGREALRRLGVPADAWYVCLHVREGGYAPESESLHSYRNADIHNFRLAVNTIASHGGWVVRMGDPSMKPLSGLPNFIDYAHSAEKSDWMDIFLCAECRLFFGNTSGLFLVSTAFGVPCALVNMIPLAAQAYGPNDIYIPKFLRDKKTGNYLRFSEILQSPIANFRDSQLFLNAEVEVEENSPEDINDLIQEALLRMKSQWSPQAGDEDRQLNFKKLFRQEHHGYKSQSRIGSSFVAKYEHLM